VAKKKVAAPKKAVKKPGPVVSTVKAVAETIVETIKHPIVAVENVLGEPGKARRTKRRAPRRKAARKVVRAVKAPGKKKAARKAAKK